MTKVFPHINRNCWKHITSQATTVEKETKVMFSLKTHHPNWKEKKQFNSKLKRDEMDKGNISERVRLKFPWVQGVDKVILYD